MSSVYPIFSYNVSLLVNAVHVLEHLVPKEQPHLQRHPQVCIDAFHIFFTDSLFLSFRLCDSMTSPFHSNKIIIRTGYPSSSFRKKKHYLIRLEILENSIYIYISFGHMYILVGVHACLSWFKLRERNLVRRHCCPISGRLQLQRPLIRIGVGARMVFRLLNAKCWP